MFETVGRLYEAAANPERWPAAVETAAQLFNAPMGQINVYNARQSRLNFSVAHGVAYSHHVLNRYAELSAGDPFTHKALKYSGKALRCSQIADRSTIRKSQMYREILQPHGIEYRVVSIVGDQESQFGIFGLMRGSNDRDFDDDDVALMSDILPHFRQAMSLYSTLSTGTTGDKFALAALNSLSVGIAIVDSNASVLFLNTAGKAIIDEEGGFALRNNHLTADRPEDAVRMLAILRQIIGESKSGVSTSADFLVLGRIDGGAPLSATIAPLVRHVDLPVPLAHVDSLAIVVFTDPCRQMEVPAELLQRLYGLTPAEGRLLAELVGGRSLEDAARALGVKKETGRKRLANIFQKTQTNRQAELVRHVLANPVWITEQAKRPSLAVASV